MLENLAVGRRESARGKIARSIQNPGGTRCIPAHVWVLCTKHKLILDIYKVALSCIYISMHI